MHIIIAGTARSGKTTLSLMLKEKGYVHYKMDSIKRGICEAYKLHYDNWDLVSPIMATIINRMIKDNKTDTNYLLEDYVFDIPFLYPKDISLIDTSNTLVIFLGYSNLTPKESFEKIREHDKENYWTSHIDNKTLMSWCYDNIEFSKYLEVECQKYNIKYFDTSNNRDEVLQNILNYIEKEEKLSKKKQLYNILMKDDVVISIRENQDTLLKIIPEIKPMIGFLHNHPHHHLDVYEHTLLALSLSEKDFEERLCLLLHDIGKPFSYQDLEVRHFKGHSSVSSNMSYEILNRIGYNKDFIDEVCFLIKYHDTPITTFDIENNYDLTLKRYSIQVKDILAHNPKQLGKRIDYLKDIANKLNVEIPKQIMKIK